MSESQQEELLAAAVLHSLGAPFLFQPTQYRKGPGVREPADLAWICRGTVLLINMQAGNRSYGQQVDHNMRQFAGWLRAWSDGIRLTGANEWQSFDLEFSDADHIVLVSVVSGHDSMAEFDHDRTDRLSARYPRLAAVVSLPQQILLDLVQWGGTALDLADYALQLATLPGLTADLASKILSEQHHAAITNVRVEAGQISDRDYSFDTEYSQRLIQNLRAMPKAALARSGSGDGVLNAAAVFNDLDWAENARIIFAITDATTMVREVPFGEIGPAAIARELAFDTYTFLVTASDVNKPAFVNVLESYRAQRPGVEPCGIHTFMAGRPEVKFYTQMFSIPRELPPSAIGQLLGKPLIEARASRPQSAGRSNVP